MTTKKQRALIADGIKIVDILYSKFLHDRQPYRYMSTEELEDIKQDAYIKMLETIKRFDETRGFKLSTFLTPRIRWFFIDCLRKMSKERRDNAEVRVSLLLNEIDPTESVYNHQCVVSVDTCSPTMIFYGYPFNIEDTINTAQVIDCLYDLPEEKMYIMLGHYIHDKSIKELSEELGYDIASGWIYKLKQETIDYLKETLNKE